MEAEEDDILAFVLLSLELEVELDCGLALFDLGSGRSGLDPARVEEDGIFLELEVPFIDSSSSFIFASSSSISGGSVGESSLGSLGVTLVGGRVGESKAGTTGSAFFDFVEALSGGSFVVESRGFLVGGGDSRVDGGGLYEDGTNLELPSRTFFVCKVPLVLSERFSVAAEGVSFLLEGGITGSLAVDAGSRDVLGFASELARPVPFLRSAGVAFLGGDFGVSFAFFL